MLKTKLRKPRGKYGMLRIWKLSELELQQVISILESIPSDLLNKGDTKNIILENGLSRSDTGFRYYFVEGTLVNLFHNHGMDGIDDS